MIRKTLFIVWILSLLAVLLASTYKLEKKTSSTTSEQAVLSSYPKNILKILFLGFDNLYENYLHIWLIQKLMDEKLSSDSIHTIKTQIESVINHEPKIESLYSLACFTLIFELQHPHICETIILKGMNALPNSWLIPMIGGYVMSFQLNNPIKASYYYHEAGQKKNAPDYPKKLAKRLLSKKSLSTKEHEDILKWLSEIPNNESFRVFLNKTQKRHP